jgi:hypothetical protein
MILPCRGRRGARIALVDPYLGVCDALIHEENNRAVAIIFVKFPFMHIPPIQKTHHYIKSG